MPQLSSKDAIVIQTVMIKNFFINIYLKFRTSIFLLSSLHLMNRFRSSAITQSVLIITPQPPACFFILYRYILCAKAIKKSNRFLFVCFFCTLQRHYKSVVGGAQIEMIFFYKWRQLTKPAKRKHHTY